jgi:Serine dehydrogenase proteinase
VSKNWNQVFEEITDEGRRRKNPYDIVRQKYLETFHNKTGRNVVCYYSGWLEKTGAQFANAVSINDEDKNGFMACFHGLKKELGLDLFLHSPGGNVAATESIIHYIRSKFGSDVRVFVPQLSMSGGTMIAFCAKEIWLGRHSNLGPIDPQFGPQPATLILEEFDEALRQIKQDPDKIHVWRPILEQIPPTYISACKYAIEWSKEIGEKALIEGMFMGQPDAADRAKSIVDYFSSVDKQKHHSRHIHREDCENAGLVVKHFETDQEMQDMILSVHHSIMLSLMNTTAIKIICNQNNILHQISFGQESV